MTIRALEQTGILSEMVLSTFKPDIGRFLYLITSFMYSNSLKIFRPNILSLNLGKNNINKNL